MFSDKPIKLEGYSAAIFIATISFDKPNPYVKHCRDSIISEETEVMGIKSISIKSNPNYTEEDEKIYNQEMKEYLKEKRQFIIGYLKENYPNTGFAKKYIELNKIEMKE